MYPGWQLPGSELNWLPWVVPAAGASTATTIDPGIALNTIRYLAYPGINPRLGLTDIPFTAAGFRQIMNATGTRSTPRTRTSARSVTPAASCSSTTGWPTRPSPRSAPSPTTRR